MASTPWSGREQAFPSLEIQACRQAIGPAGHPRILRRPRPKGAETQREAKGKVGKGHPQAGHDAIVAVN